VPDKKQKRGRADIIACEACYPREDGGPLHPLLNSQDFLVTVFASNKTAWRGIKKYCKDRFAGSLPVSINRSNLAPVILTIFGDPALRSDYNLACSRREESGMYPLHLAIWRWAMADAGVHGMIRKALTEDRGKQFLAVSRLAEVLQSRPVEECGAPALLSLFRLILGFAILQRDDRGLILHLLEGHDRYQEVFDLAQLEICPVFPGQVSPQDSGCEPLALVQDPRFATVVQLAGEARECAFRMERDRKEIVDRVERLVSDPQVQPSPKGLADMGAMLRDRGERLQEMESHLTQLLMELGKQAGAVTGRRSKVPAVVELKRIIGELADKEPGGRVRYDEIVLVCQAIPQQYRYAASSELVTRLLDKLRSWGVRDALTDEAWAIIEGSAAEAAGRLDALESELSAVLEGKEDCARAEIANANDFVAGLAKYVGLETFQWPDIAGAKVEPGYSLALAEAFRRDLASTLKYQADRGPEIWIEGLCSATDGITLNDCASDFASILIEAVDQKWPLSLASSPRALAFLSAFARSRSESVLHLARASPGVALSLIQAMSSEETDLNPGLLQVCYASFLAWLGHNGLCLSRFIVWEHLKDLNDSYWELGSAVLAEYVEDSVAKAAMAERPYNFVTAARFLKSRAEYLEFGASAETRWFRLLITICALVTGEEDLWEDIYSIATRFEAKVYERLLPELHLIHGSPIARRVDLLKIEVSDEQGDEKREILKPHGYGAVRVAYLIEEEVIFAKLRAWMAQVETLGPRESQSVIEEVRSLDVAGLIQREMRMRARKAMPKESVTKSLVQRTQRRFDSLISWIENAGKRKATSPGSTIRDLCPLGLRKFCRQCFSLLRLNSGSEAEKPDPSADWLFYESSEPVADLGTALGLADWVLAGGSRSDVDAAATESAYQQMMSGKWLGNEFDAASVRSQLITEGNIAVARLVLQVYPNIEDQETINAVDLRTAEEVRATLSRIRQQEALISRQEISLGLEATVGLNSETQRHVEAAEGLLLHKHLDAARLETDKASAELSRRLERVQGTAAERRESLEAARASMADRLREAAIEASDKQIVILKQVLRQLHALAGQDIIDAANVELLKAAFSAAFEGDLESSEAMLSGGRATAMQPATFPKATGTPGDTPSMPWEAMTTHLKRAEFDDAVALLIQRIDDEALVYEVLWYWVPYLKACGVPRDDLKPLDEALSRAHLYRVVDVSLHYAELCGSLGIAMGLDRGGVNRSSLEVAFQDPNVHFYVGALAKALQALDSQGAFQLFRQWSRLFPDNSALLVEYGYLARNLNDFEAAWRAWSRATTLGPSPQKLMILSDQCGKAGFHGLAAYYAARARRQSLLEHERLATRNSSYGPPAVEAAAQDKYQYERNAECTRKNAFVDFVGTRIQTYQARYLLDDAQNNFGRALDLLIRSLVCDPDYWVAGRTLLELLTSEEVSGEIISLDEGINLINDFLLPVHPRNGHLHYLLAELYFSRNDDQKGWEALSKATEFQFRYANRKVKELQQDMLDGLQKGAFFCRGRFKVLERLDGAQGSSGIVLKAEDHKQAQKICAVKALRASSRFASDPGRARQQFEAEAKIAIALNHESIVNTYDFEEDGQQQFIVMEFVDGSPLDEHIQRQGRLRWEDAVRLIEKLLSALKYAGEESKRLGSHEFYHRDIAPRNIMVRGDKGIKLLDFGHAQMGSARRSTSGTLNLRDVYKAPETRLSPSWSVRAEIFSIGVILHQMITAELPYDQQEWLDYDNDNPPDYSEIPSSLAIPESLSNLIRRMVSLTPGNRPVSYLNVIEELDRQ
jgi:tRNA A-37 threonylcarbamoyl transferase component Bud32